MVVLCRDDDDYDAMVKIIAVASRRKNVIVVIYAVVSNHCHVATLALSQEEAQAYGDEIKRMYSMWFSRKYLERKTMKGTSVSALALENDWHIRNALAYIPRNALDNGCQVATYPWSGYTAMFQSRTNPQSRKGLVPGRTWRNERPVARLTKRDREAIMHTGDDLSHVSWLLDEHDRLIPASFCDSAYLEQAFNNDPAFFLKTIGSLNPAEMQWKLVDAPRRRQSDTEFLASVNDVSQRWFQLQTRDLSIEKKLRMIPYISRTMRTSIPQLARIFGLKRETIAGVLRRRA